MCSKTGTTGDNQSLGIEHPDLLPGCLGCHALLAHPVNNQVGETDRGGARAEKEDALVL